MLTEKLLHNYSNFSSLILVSYIQFFFSFSGFETKYNNYFNFFVCKFYFYNFARKFLFCSFEKIVQKLFTLLFLVSWL